jgi:hypothetical protein
MRAMIITFWSEIWKGIEHLEVLVLHGILIIRTRDTNNTKLKVREVRCQDVGWIDVAQSWTYTKSLKFLE